MKQSASFALAVVLASMTIGSEAGKSRQSSNVQCSGNAQCSNSQSSEQKPSISPTFSPSVPVSLMGGGARKARRGVAELFPEFEMLYRRAAAEKAAGGKTSGKVDAARKEKGGASEKSGGKKERTCLPQASPQNFSRDLTLPTAVYAEDVASMIKNNQKLPAGLHGPAVQLAKEEGLTPPSEAKLKPTPPKFAKLSIKSALAALQKGKVRPLVEAAAKAAWGKAGGKGGKGGAEGAGKGKAGGGKASGGKVKARDASYDEEELYVRDPEAEFDVEPYILERSAEPELEGDGIYAREAYYDDDLFEIYLRDAEADPEIFEYASLEY